MPKKTSRLALIALVSTVLAVVTPAAAFAHDEIIGSHPAQGETVDVLPGEVILDFSAALLSQVGGTAVTVVDEQGNSVIDGEPVVEGATVTQALLPGTIAGDYTVEWRVVSSDGHPISGTITFTVTTSSSPAVTPSAPGTDVATAAPQPSDPSDTSPSPSAEPTTPPVEDSSENAGAVVAWVLGIAAAAFVVLVALIWASSRRKRGASGDDSGDNAPDNSSPTSGQ